MAEPDLVIATALRLEAVAVRRGAPCARIVRVGMRARHADRVRAALAEPTALAIAGVAGALVPGLAAGDVVVADEVRSARGNHRCPAAPRLAAELRRAGLTVHIGPIVESDRIAGKADRAGLAATGAIAVDMESARLAESAGARPLAVVRSIVDTPARPLARLSVVRDGLTGLAALRRIGPALCRWAATTESAIPCAFHPPAHPKEVRHQ